MAAGDERLAECVKATRRFRSRGVVETLCVEARTGGGQEQLWQGRLLERLAEVGLCVYEGQKAERCCIVCLLLGVARGSALERRTRR